MIQENIATRTALYALKEFFPFIPLAFLWFLLIKALSVEWTLSPQYSYGWIVPVLMFGLLLQRWRSWKECRPKSISQGFGGRSLKSFGVDSWSVAFFAASAGLLLPVRLVLEANPNWRTPQLLLAGVVITLTLIAISWRLGAWSAFHFAFPFAFILVAVPWPPSIETPLVQGLSRANVGTTVELLSWLGIPAVQHGNVIEVSTGLVGINEACSGIRSFQSSIMIALFFGEFYHLGLRSRLLLVPLGLLVAFVFNVGRTSLLTWIAADQGVPAIEHYHDRAGVTIALGCTFVLWLFAWWIARTRRAVLPNSTSAGSLDGSAPGAQSAAFALSHPCALLNPASSCLLIWLLAVQAGVELWYRLREAGPNQRAEWTLVPPEQELQFKELVVPQTAREILKYDEGYSWAWISASGMQWRLFYFRWLPGKIAVTSARGHTPDICLAAAGKELRQVENNQCPMTILSLRLPFRRYEYQENGQTVYVFHCLWEDHAPGNYFSAGVQTGWLSDPRLVNVIEGRRNLGQRSIEVAITGLPHSDAAQAAAQAQLEKLIKILNR